MSTHPSWTWTIIQLLAIGTASLTGAYLGVRLARRAWRANRLRDRWPRPENIPPDGRPGRR